MFSRTGLALWAISGGKWAMFASVHDKFAAAVWSDPGVVFDERDRRKQNPSGSVNYWDVWYLGFDLGGIADTGMQVPGANSPVKASHEPGPTKRLWKPDTI